MTYSVSLFGLNEIFSVEKNIMKMFECADNVVKDHIVLFRFHASNFPMDGKRGGDLQQCRKQF